ncbi:hypothetical protein C8Q78DRAFT_140787 [Trametes maxima]|nr:hypothetical protein C8Q78DRAFT_140787 [Trametes maxima]
MASGSPQQGFDLDISGVAGFFGGDASVSAMATVHIYEGRKWLGWYNQPGSFEIAKRYGQLSRSRFWDALYPGVNVDPAVLFEFDGMEGPKFTAVRSGTVLPKTGHVAQLFVDECKDLPIALSPKDIPGTKTRVAKPGFVTIADLPHAPHPVETPRQQRNAASALACIPILASIAACASCAVLHDWYSFASILIGIIASGVSCYVIGMGVLTFSHPEAAPGAPRGDGVMDSGGNELVVVRGEEKAVNSITRGCFSLEYDSKPQYHTIGASAMLLTLQFLAQLLLIPQGTLHGQILFLASLAFSWGYNSYLSSLDKASIQRTILIDQVLRIADKDAGMKKYELGTRTQMVVFTLLALAPAKETALKKVLDDLLPNDTDVWNLWKAHVLPRIAAGFSPDGTIILENHRLFPGPSGDATSSLSADECKLLNTLCEDANAAAMMYRMHLQLHSQPRPTSDRYGSAKSTNSSRRGGARPSVGSLSYVPLSPSNSSESLVARQV